MQDFWREDRITENYMAENKAMLAHPEAMNAKELANACTYCKTIHNPYAEELMRRCGFLEKFQKAKEQEKQWKILDKACAHFGIKLY